jgi:uncharacterized protein
MAILFLDASAVVKRYIREPGSAWVRQVCEERDEDGRKLNLVAIAEISRVEVAAAFAVLVRRNEISKTLGERAYKEFIDELEQEYRSVRLTPEVPHHAADLTQRHPLKAYDAVQLATALAYDGLLKRAQLSLTFISGDDRLLQAANVEGLVADNPFSHTDLD